MLSVAKIKQRLSQNSGHSIVIYYKLRITLDNLHIFRLRTLFVTTHHALHFICSINQSNGDRDCSSDRAKLSVEQTILTHPSSI